MQKMNIQPMERNFSEVLSDSVSSAETLHSRQLTPFRTVFACFESKQTPNQIRELVSDLVGKRQLR